MQAKDPLIDELHAIREAIATAYGDDMDKIAEAMRAQQTIGNREIVTLPPKRLVEKKAS